jgi:Flp pilus assembly protein TadG
MLVKHSYKERGQALILLVLGMVSLIGLTALAIDGGNIFSDRRHAQNAADTAALAAALAKARDQNWSAAALGRAASNGYDNDGASNIVEVHSPPVSGTYAGNAEYIQVIITSNVETFFAGIVGVTQVTNRVEAIARSRPPIASEMYFGNAMVSLSPDTCKSFLYGGTAGTSVIGGGLFVNSNCSCADSAAFFNASSSARLDASEGITAVGCIKYKEGAVTGPAQSGADPVAYPPEYVMPNPTCSGDAVWNNTTKTLSPGHWTGDFPPSQTAHLEPGVYCVNGDFKITSSNAALTGSEVTIHVTSGEVRFNGGYVDLSAPTSGPYKGLLISLPITNSSEVVLNGNASWSITGTILAPASNCTINGTEDGFALNSQVICYNINLTGTGSTTINYNDADNYNATLPPAIELTR